MRATEMACGSLLEGSAFLVSDDHDFASPKLGKPGEHGAIIPEEFIAMKLDEFVEG
jgi:hypothetical protein